MARWFHIRNGSGAEARVWGKLTPLGHASADGDAIFAARPGRFTDCRFRFGPKDSERRFSIETHGGLAATIDAAGDVILRPSAPGDPRQLWRWGQRGQLMNEHNGLAVAFVATPQGEKLTTRDLLAGDLTGNWNILASGPSDGSAVSLLNSWSTVYSEGAYQTTCQIAAINLPGQPSGIAASPTLGTGFIVVTANLVPSTPGQLWYCTPSSNYPSSYLIVCAENPGLLLTATLAGTVYVAAPLVAPAANPELQCWQWTFDLQPTLVNLATQQALTFGLPGAGLTVQPIPNPPAANQQCAWTPGSPIEVITSQPPQPFPTFTGDQAAAYDYICSKLTLSSAPGADLRAAYEDPNATLGSYQIDIAGYTCPAGVSQDDWETVTDQLNMELTAVIAVNNLFASYNSFHTDAFVAQTTALNQLASDMNVPTSTNINGVRSALLEGSIYTILSAFPDVGGIIGNIFETAYNVAAADGTASSAPFECAYSQLWDQLSSSFGAILDETGVQQGNIVKDWGMSQAIYNLTLPPPGGPDSLFWTDNTAPNGVTAAQQWQLLSALKMLLPTQYFAARGGGCLYPTVPQNGYVMAPSGSWWWTSDYLLDIYWVIVNKDSASPGFHSQHFLPAKASTDIAKNGGTLQGMPLTILDGQGDLGYGYGGWPSNTLLASIVNMSECTLSVQLTAQEGYLCGFPQGLGPLTLWPYATMDFATIHSGGLRVQVAISNPAESDPPVSISCLLHLSSSDPKNIWVDTVSQPAGGLSFGSAVIQQEQSSGFISKTWTCGSVVVPVYVKTTLPTPPPASSGSLTMQSDPSVWGSSLTVYCFESYQDAMGYGPGQDGQPNWSTGAGSVTSGTLQNNGVGLTGMPSGWLAIVAQVGGAPQLFMIVSYSNDVTLQLGADGAQPGVVVGGVTYPAIPPNSGSIAMAPNLEIWNNGLQYAIFSTCDEALQNWSNPAPTALAYGMLDADGTPATSLPSGWLVLYGTNAESVGYPIPYVIVQYDNVITVLLQPFLAQPAFNFNAG